jgi:hypothetical protein
MDIMIVLNHVKVVHNVQQINYSAQCTTLLMEDNMEIPGFSRLKLIAEVDQEYIYTSPECFVETSNGMFLSNISFIRQFTKGTFMVHGPCVSDIYSHN